MLAATYLKVGGTLIYMHWQTHTVIFDHQLHQQKHPNILVVLHILLKQKLRWKRREKKYHIDSAVSSSVAGESITLKL